MAEGKKIDIKIAASGGDAAAQEIKKTGEAASQANVRIIDSTKQSTAAIEENKKAFAEWQAQRNAARKENGTSALATDPDKTVSAVNAEIKAREEAVRAKEAEREATARLKEEKKKLAEAEREARQGLSNSRSAITGLSSSMGSLISRTGIVGTMLRSLLNPYALVGTAIGLITAGIAKWIEKSKELAEQERKTIEEAKKGLQELREQYANIASEKRLAATAEWIKSLEREKDVHAEINQLIRDQLELMRAREDAEAGVEAAKREEEIAKIENDPNKDDATKKREVAAVRERQMRDQVEQQKKRITRSVEDASLDESAAVQALRKEQEQVKAIALSYQEEAERLEAVRRKVIEADRAQAAIATTEGRIKQANLELSNATNSGNALGGMNTSYDPKKAAKIREEIAALERLRNEQQIAAGAATNNDRKMAGERDDKIPNRFKGGELEAEVKAKEAALKEANEKAVAANKALAEAERKAAKARELASIQLPAIDKQYSSGQAARQAETEGSIREIQMREQEKKRSEEEQLQKERERLLEQKGAAHSSLEADAVGIGNRAGKALRRLGAPTYAAALERGGQAIARAGNQSGDTEEAAKMAQMITKLVDLLEKNGQGGNSDTQELRKVREDLEKRINILQRQMKNNG